MHACSVMSDSLWPHRLSPPGSSVCGIFQARILEWVAISYLRGSSWPGIKAASRVAPEWSGRFLTIEPPGKPIFKGYLLLYSRKLKGKCQGKDGDIHSRPFLSYLSSKEKFLCVSPLTTIHSETSQWLMPWRRESCFVTSSFLEFNVCEWILQYEYKIAIDQAQRCISTWGFPGPCFGKNLKHN